MKQIIAILIIAFTLGVSGCASKLQNFNKTQQLSPEANKGVVVIAYDSDTSIHSLILSGPSKFELDHTLYSDKHNFVITSLPAGNYEITRTKIYNRYNYITLGTDQDANWGFDVQPNKINYIGHFNIKNMGSGYQVQTKNDSTLALEFLEENYKSLLEQYPLVYAKDGPKDEFFNYVESLKGDNND